MFTPSQDDVRRFFCETYQKLIANEILTPLEAMAADWIQEHPEYHQDLADLEQALAARFDVDDGKTNPFLHLAMHLSIAEQISIDQPRGVKAVSSTLQNKLNSLHEAHHQMMEALGLMIWESQRSGRPPDGEAYLDNLRRRASSPHSSSAVR